MTMRYIKRESRALLEQAKSIFGEKAVVRAYITTWDVVGVTDVCDIKVRLDKILSEFEHGSSESYLGYDTHTIILVFSNGRAVMFTNSEWASMSVVDIDEVPDGPL